jgi:hypothetical protein
MPLSSSKGPNFRLTARSRSSGATRMRAGAVDRRPSAECTQRGAAAAPTRGCRLTHPRGMSWKVLSIHSGRGGADGQQSHARTSAANVPRRLTAPVGVARRDGQQKVDGQRTAQVGLFCRQPRVSGVKGRAETTRKETKGRVATTTTTTRTTTESNREPIPAVSGRGGTSLENRGRRTGLRLGWCGPFSLCSRLGTGPRPTDQRRWVCCSPFLQRCARNDAAQSFSGTRSRSGAGRGRAEPSLPHLERTEGCCSGSTDADLSRLWAPSRAYDARMAHSFVPARVR